MNTFNESMRLEMGLFSSKLFDLTKVLHTTAERNHGTSNAQIELLDDEDHLITHSEDNLNQIWAGCKERHQNTLEYVEQYKR